MHEEIFNNCKVCGKHFVAEDRERNNEVVPLVFPEGADIQNIRNQERIILIELDVFEPRTSTSAQMALKVVSVVAGNCSSHSSSPKDKEEL
ncbi:hypothetical protein Trydic_g18057 [Trypoxylus dichotomus]